MVLYHGFLLRRVDPLQLLNGQGRQSFTSASQTLPPRSVQAAGGLLAHGSLTGLWRVAAPEGLVLTALCWPGLYAPSGGTHLNGPNTVRARSAASVSAQGLLPLDVAAAAWN